MTTPFATALRTAEHARHGATPPLPAAGIEMKMVQERLGPTRYATTADLYTTVFPSLDRHEAQRVGPIYAQFVIALASPAPPY